MASSPDELSAETLVAQALGTIDGDTGAVTPPLYFSSTYARRGEDYARIGAAGYSRDDNPTYRLPERVIATLHRGADARLFASGMAALNALIQALRPGAHMVCSREMYFGTPKWLDELVRPWGLGITYVDSSNLAEVEAAIQADTQLLLVETPANPTWTVSDIPALADLARRYNVYFCVDNTAASPVMQRPLNLGAELVVESASKYLNGHSDVVCGVITAADPQHPLLLGASRARYLAGAVLGPMEAWLLLRGLRTIHIRVRRCADSAAAIAQHFDGHPRVAAVHYPGLASFPGHAAAKRQMLEGYGGMLSLRIAGGEAAALEVAKACRIFIRATSLGGVESLIEHRATIEGEACTCPRDMLRVSVGLEDPQDLIADLEQALVAAGAG